MNKKKEKHMILMMFLFSLPLPLLPSPLLCLFLVPTLPSSPSLCIDKCNLFNDIHMNKTNYNGLNTLILKNSS